MTTPPSPVTTQSRPSAARHLAAALLLIGVVAISYGLVESLRGEPCAGERTAWVAGRLIAAAFAVYLFAGAWMVAARRYVAMAILTLWAWHLLVLSPFLATSCSEQRNLDRLREVAGFGLPEFVIAAVLVASASSFALASRYPRANGSAVSHRRTLLRLAVAGATAVAVALAAGAYWTVPHLSEAYAMLGPDLPSPTLVLLDAHEYWALLPLACVTALLYVGLKERYSERQLQLAMNGTVGLIVLLNVASSLFLFSAFAPIKTMCGCV